MYHFIYEIATGRIQQVQTFSFASVPTGSSPVQSEVMPNPNTQLYHPDQGLYTRPDLAEFEHQQQLARIRHRRNRRLADSDWTQLPDTALTTQQRTAWQQYRQALRDITESLPEILLSNYQVTWPTPPGESS